MPETFIEAELQRIDYEVNDGRKGAPCKMPIRYLGEETMIIRMQPFWLVQCRMGVPALTATYVTQSSSSLRNRVSGVAVR